MKFVYLVWSNLRRKKLRGSLTLLSILVAFVLFGLLSALKLALVGGVVMADANRMSYDYFDEARAFGAGQVGWYQVRVTDPERVTAVAAAIDAEFANSPAETKTESEGAMFQGFAQQIGDIGAIVTAILGAVFFTILLVAGNTMAQSVRERTQELALLKAVGFTDALVLAVVLGESFLIAVLGGALGLIFSWFLVAGLQQASFVRAFFPIFFIPPRDLMLGVGLAVGLGFVAGILPALQAMRLHVADALRREG